MNNRAVYTGLLLIFFLGIPLLQIFSDLEAPFQPEYPRTDIQSILCKKTLSHEDYQTIFYQTGLAKPAIDQLLKKSDDGFERILEFQRTFFRTPNIECEKTSIVTRGDHQWDSKSRPSLAPLQEGDIFLSFAAHTFSWHHGHAGLVIDAKSGTSLEAMTLGDNSQQMRVNRWPNYSHFMILRLKGASLETRQAIADFAKQHLLGIPYSLTSGVFGQKAPAVGEDLNAQCAYLVWYAFQEFGFDLDSDGGRIVTVKDLAESSELQIVQIYGMDPGDFQPGP